MKEQQDELLSLDATLAELQDTVAGLNVDQLRPGPTNEISIRSISNYLDEFTQELEHQFGAITDEVDEDALVKFFDDVDHRQRMEHINVMLSSLVSSYRNNIGIITSGVRQYLQKIKDQVDGIEQRYVKLVDNASDRTLNKYRNALNGQVSEVRGLALELKQINLSHTHPQFDSLTESQARLADQLNLTDERVEELWNREPIVQTIVHPETPEQTPHALEHLPGGNDTIPPASEDRSGLMTPQMVSRLEKAYASAGQRNSGQIGGGLSRLEHAGNVKGQATNGQVLTYVASSRTWEPKTPTGGPGGVAQLEDRVGFAAVSVNNIVAGVKAYRTIPFDATITGWYIDSDSNGDVTVDVQRGMTTPVSLVGSGTKPFLSSASSNSDSSPDWDTLSVTEGDILVFELPSDATVKKIVLTLDLLSN